MKDNERAMRVLTVIAVIIVLLVITAAWVLFLGWLCSLWPGGGDLICYSGGMVLALFWFAVFISVID